jgi:hypothetical protein
LVGVPVISKEGPTPGRLGYRPGGPRGTQVFQAVYEVELSEEDLEEGKLEITRAENALGGN